MQHIQFLFYLFSLFTGISALSTSFFVLMKFKKKILKYYLLFGGSLFLLEIGMLFCSYLTIARLTDAVFIWGYRIIISSGWIAVVATSPLLAVEMIGIIIPAGFRPLFLLPPLIQLVLLILHWSAPDSIFFLTSCSVFFNAVIGASIIGAFLGRDYIGDSLLKSFFKRFTIISLIFLVPFLLQPFAYGIRSFHWLQIVDMTALPVYLIFININLIHLSLTYMSIPVFFENNKLTGLFLAHYQITGREQDIISRLIEGLTYKEIAEREYIAFKAVDNHVQNIFRKTNVKNRQQLLNLILTNRA